MDGGTIDGVGIALCGAALVARGSGALWWPSERTLAVADLHLGKSGRLARRGGTLLPPYETAATLDRLAAELAALAPARVLCLGDSFDDLAAGESLAGPDRDRLLALMAGRDWVWVAGNHDPAPLDLPGPHRAELRLGPLAFRHEARAAETGEVSGHWHPKVRALPGGRGVGRPAFLADAARVILPAFGAYTGGLDARHPALAHLMGRDARAILTGRQALALPLSRLPERTPR